MPRVTVETEDDVKHEFEATGLVIIALEEDVEKGVMYNELWQSRPLVTDLIRSLRACSKALMESGNDMVVPIGEMTLHNLDNFMEGIREIQKHVEGGDN